MTESSQEQPEQESQGHPAWQPILEALDELPDDFKAIIEPKITEQLKAWDQTVQGKLQDSSSKFDPYKPLLEHGVPMERVEQALWLAHQLESNPQEVVQKAIEAYNLGYVPADQVSGDPSGTDDNEFDEGDMQDLANHPLIKQMQQQFEQIQQREQQQQEQLQQSTAQQQLDAYLKELHDEHGEFNDLYVTALMANGADPVEAINEYKAEVKTAAQAMLGQQQQAEQPPIVMGEEGTSGSGVPAQATDFGSMTNNDVENLVLQMLNAGNNPG